MPANTCISVLCGIPRLGQDSKQRLGEASATFNSHSFTFLDLFILFLAFVCFILLLLFAILYVITFNHPPVER